MSTQSSIASPQPQLAIVEFEQETVRALKVWWL